MSTQYAIGSLMCLLCGLVPSKPLCLCLTHLVHLFSWSMRSRLQFYSDRTYGYVVHSLYNGMLAHSRQKVGKIKKVHHIEALEYIEKMRAASPIVWWKSICYHYVRRTRQVTRYRNGDAITATQAYYERVNSHSAGNVSMFDVCGVKEIYPNVWWISIGFR
uniref:Transmembrane protein 151 n=1 Tax=Ascaris suum TaxID=6253 RepID=F1LDT3_ASCSU